MRLAMIILAQLVRDLVMVCCR